MISFNSYTSIEFVTYLYVDLKHWVDFLGKQAQSYLSD